MAKKLHYFDTNALGEAIRYILHYGGEKFEDIRYDVKSWPIKKVKDTLPFGQFPLYEEGNRSLNQSVAIARYLAAKVNLLPSDPWDQALLDAMVLNLYDFWNKVLIYIREEDAVKKQALKAQILKQDVDFYFSRFEKQLKANGGYFYGQLTWAGFILTGIVEAADLYLETKIEDNYPFVKALITKVRSLPGVKEYIASRKPYTI